MCAFKGKPQAGQPPRARPFAWRLFPEFCDMRLLSYALVPAGLASAVWTSGGSMECGATNQQATVDPDEFLLIYLSKGATVDFTITSAKSGSACAQVRRPVSLGTRRGPPTSPAPRRCGLCRSRRA